MDKFSLKELQKISFYRNLSLRDFGKTNGRKEVKSQYKQKETLEDLANCMYKWNQINIKILSIAIRINIGISVTNPRRKEK